MQRKIKIGMAALAALATALGPAPSLAQDNTRVFTPSGPWTADFGEDYCRLVRSFSDGRDTVSVAFERHYPDSRMRLTVLGDAITTFRSATELGVDFLPSGQPSMYPYARSTSEDGQQLLMFTFVSVDDEVLTYRGGRYAADAAAVLPAARDGRERERAAEITALSLSAGLTRPVRLETGSLRNAVQVLQDCTYDLLTTWGLESEKHRTLSREVSEPEHYSPPMTIIPAGERASLVNDFVAARLVTDAQGLQQSCTVIGSLLSDGTEARLCDNLMRNIRLQPALDVEGNPIASYYIWLLSAMPRR